MGKGGAAPEKEGGPSGVSRDKWRNLMLLMKIYRKLAFWRPRFKFMSAHDLTQTLYDKHIDKGDGDVYLDMKELVLNDQDVKKSEERKVRIEADWQIEHFSVSNLPVHLGCPHPHDFKPTKKHPFSA